MDSTDASATVAVVTLDPKSREQLATMVAGTSGERSNKTEISFVIEDPHQAWENSKPKTNSLAQAKDLRTQELTDTAKNTIAILEQQAKIKSNLLIPQLVAQQKQDTDIALNRELYLYKNTVRDLVLAHDLALQDKPEEAKKILDGSQKYYQLEGRNFKAQAEELLKQDPATLSQTRDGLRQAIETGRNSLELTSASIRDLDKELAKPGVITQQKAFILEHQTLLKAQQDLTLERTRSNIDLHKIATARINGEAIPGITATRRSESSSKEVMQAQLTRTKSEEEVYQSALKSIKELKNKDVNIDQASTSSESRAKSDQEDFDKINTFHNIITDGKLTESKSESIKAENQFQRQLAVDKKALDPQKALIDKAMRNGDYAKAEQLAESLIHQKQFTLQESRSMLFKGLDRSTESAIDADKKAVAFKESAKQTAIFVAAAAAAIPSGGTSLMAFAGAASLGTGVGFGTGLMVDTIDAGVEANIGNKSFSESMKENLSLGHLGSNLKTSVVAAGSVATGGYVTQSLLKVGGGMITSSMIGGGTAAGAASAEGLAEARVAAEMEFNKLSKIQNWTREERATQYDKFLEERNLTVPQMAKALAIDTTVGALSAGIGSKAGALKDAATTRFSRAVVSSGEEFLQTGLGLGGTFVKEGELTAQGFVEEMQSVVGGRIAGAAKSADSNLAKPKYRVSDILPDGVSAQTTVELDSRTGKRKSSIEETPEQQTARKQGDDAALKTDAEEQTHAREKVVDPGNPKSDKPLMSQTEYFARRASLEIGSEINALALVSKGPVTETERSSIAAHIQALTDINSKIQEAEASPIDKKRLYTEAANLAKDSKLITEQDLKQFREDYDYNTTRNPETDSLRQVSNSSVAEKIRDTITSLDDPRVKHIIEALEGEPNGTVITAELFNIDGAELGRPSTRVVDTKDPGYRHPIMVQGVVEIVMPESGLPSIREPIKGNNKFYDTGVRLKVGDKEIPIAIPDEVSLKTGTGKVPHSEISAEQIQELAQGWQQLKDGITIGNGKYSEARETGRGLRHITEIHAQPITDVTHLIEEGQVKQASQFPYTLNETQVLELVQASMQNVTSAMVGRDGALTITANLPESVKHLAPGIDEVRAIISPKDGILTFIPLGKGVVRATLVHEDDIPKEGFKAGQNINKFIARGDRLNDLSKLVIVRVDPNTNPKFIGMGGIPQLPQGDN